jgi:hypothetical protein
MSTRNGFVRLLPVVIVCALGVGAPNTTFAQLTVPGPKASATAKMLSISGIESGVVFTAQTNPREIQVDKAVLWQKAPTSRSDQPELQSTGADGRSMSFDLTFDTSPTGVDVYNTWLTKLVTLSMIMDLNGPEEKRRPSRVKVQWGSPAILFEGVIDSIGIKYTQFLQDGTPVKATCSVKLKEASRASFRR